MNLDRQKYRQIELQIDRNIDRQKYKQNYRQILLQIDRTIDRQKYRQKEIQIDLSIHMYILNRIKQLQMDITLVRKNIKIRIDYNYR